MLKISFIGNPYIFLFLWYYCLISTHAPAIILFIWVNLCVIINSHFIWSSSSIVEIIRALTSIASLVIQSLILIRLLLLLISHIRFIISIWIVLLSTIVHVAMLRTILHWTIHIRVFIINMSAIRYVGALESAMLNLRKTLEVLLHLLIRLIHILILFILVILLWTVSIHFVSLSRRAFSILRAILIILFGIIVLLLTILTVINWLIIETILWRSWWYLLPWHLVETTVEWMLLLLLLLSILIPSHLSIISIFWHRLINIWLLSVGIIRMKELGIILLNIVISNVGNRWIYLTSATSKITVNWSRLIFGLASNEKEWRFLCTVISWFLSLVFIFIFFCRSA